MGPADLLAWLRMAGLLIEAEGDTLRITGGLDEKRRAQIREHKAELLELLAAESDAGPALANAIDRTCSARGDDANNRAALLAECAGLLPEHQRDMLQHFVVEAVRWTH